MGAKRKNFREVEDFELRDFTLDTSLISISMSVMCLLSSFVACRMMFRRDCLVLVSLLLLF